jgi:hypothetical protein
MELLLLSGYSRNRKLNISPMRWDATRTGYFSGTDWRGSELTTKLQFFVFYYVASYHIKIERLALLYSLTGQPPGEFEWEPCWAL